jgi:hypothetical protein
MLHMLGVKFSKGQCPRRELFAIGKFQLKDGFLPQNILIGIARKWSSKGPLE